MVFFLQDLETSDLKCEILQILKILESLETLDIFDILEILKVLELLAIFRTIDILNIHHKARPTCRVCHQALPGGHSAASGHPFRLPGHQAQWHTVI